MVTTCVVTTLRDAVTRTYAKRKKWDAKRLRHLRKLVLAGMNDREIACRMKANYQVVQRQRRKFGLSSTGNHSEGSRRKQAAIMSRRNKGVPTTIARCKAAQLGWPNARGVGSVRVLNVLLDGPATANAISKRLGINSSTVCTHLRTLRSDGLIVVVGKEIIGIMRARIIWRLTISKHQTNIKHSNNYDIDGKRKN